MDARVDEVELLDGQVGAEILTDIHWMTLRVTPSLRDLEKGAFILPDWGEVVEPPQISYEIVLATPDRLRQCPFPPFRASSSRSAASSVISAGQP